MRVFGKKMFGKEEQVEAPLNLDGSYTQHSPQNTAEEYYRDDLAEPNQNFDVGNYKQSPYANESFGENTEATESYSQQQNPYEQQPNYTRNQFLNQQNETKTEKSQETELILAKLDAIKANVEHINQRLINLENKTQEKENRNKIWQQ